MNEELLGFLRRLSWDGHPRPAWDLVSPFLLEAVFWVLVLVAFMLLRHRAAQSRWWIRLQASLRCIGRHRRAVLVCVFVLSISARLALVPWLGLPVPGAHDEPSYLLGADTFAHGRLTTPVHPMAVFFETFHENMWPTYQSMYPPAQSAFLALGQVLFGMPFAGVLLGCALMCVAIVWAVQEWMPPQWSVLVAAFCVLRFSTFSVWDNSYLGGAVASLGGALLFASLARIRKKPSASCFVLYAVGLLLLANSRPYEGFVFSVVPTVVLFWWMLKQSEPKKMVRLVAPAVVLLFVGFAWMGYYNWRGTGHATKMPYVANHEQYHITNPFMWQKPRPIPNYRHLQMRREYVSWELPTALVINTSWGFQALIEHKLSEAYMFAVWPLGALLLPAWWVLLFRSRKLRIFGVTLVAFVAGLLVETWALQAQYMAPAVATFIVLLVFGLRWVQTWTVGTVRVGRELALMIVVVLFGWLLVRQANAVLDPYRLYGYAPSVRSDIERERLMAELGKHPGKHLVIVHSTRSSDSSVDYVFNRSDIDGSKVVWARDMGAIANRRLLDYYRDRQVWSLEQSDGFPQLFPYTEGGPVAYYSLQSLGLTQVPALFASSVPCPDPATLPCYHPSK